jgi:uncharacterized protein (DUF433 family)
MNKCFLKKNTLYRLKNVYLHTFSIKLLNIEIEMAFFPNIVSNPEILGGKPCIRGTRISVELIMEWLSTGGTPDTIAAKHPLLTPLLVLEAIRYAARFTKNEVIIEIVHAAA